MKRNKTEKNLIEKYFMKCDFIIEANLQITCNDFNFSRRFKKILIDVKLTRENKLVKSTVAFFHAKHAN